MSLKEFFMRLPHRLSDNHEESRIERNLKNTFRSFSSSEKVLFFVFTTVMIVSGVLILMQVNNQFLIEVPSVGGKFTEGVVGSPRFINPVLAISDTDKSLVSLIYAGLVKSSKEGGVQNDLAQNVSVSDDGLVYEITIRDDAYFHDNIPVTTSDVIFTIEKVVDPVIKSNKRNNFEGVKIEKIDEKNMRFILSRSYTPFIDALTIGILPKHAWESATSEEFPFSDLNINPVGAGAYKVESVKKNSAGIPLSMTIGLSKKYWDKSYKIKSAIFKFYENEESLVKAYKENEVDSVLGTRDTIKDVDSQNILSSSLPRVFGVFFNQNNAQVLLNKEVRQALDMTAPKDRIVGEVLEERGSVLLGMLPSFSRNMETTDEEAKLTEAMILLEDNGWSAGEDGVLTKKTKTGSQRLAFSISTSDNENLKKIAEMLRQSWTRLGAEVEVKVFESSDLNQNIIRTRKYDALLFGEIISPESDLYPFWHSSERNDPGLNISLYANITTDKILEDLRTEKNQETRLQKIDELSKEINKDLPVIFLFAPDYIYIKSGNIKNASLKKVSGISDRFASIGEWYIETERVWKIFAE